MAGFEILPVNAGHYDANQNSSITGVIGTLGTADTKGTALPLPFGVDPSTGAAYVNVIQGSINIGTVAEELTIVGGTLNAATVTVLGGTINAGTVTVGSISAIGQLHNAGTLSGGTLGVVSALTSGTVSINTPGTITSGSIVVTAGSVIGTVTTNQNSGTLNVGTINSSTVNLATVVGKDANAAATTSFPILTAGMDSGGTAYTYLVDTSRRIHNVMEIGTLNAGTVSVNTPGTITSGTISVNTPGTITSGSISVIAGTIGAGTLNTLGTISNLLAGTIQNSGTVTGVGTVSGVGEVGTVDGVGGTVKVNVVAGGAGGGVADLQIRDESGTTWVDVGVGTSTSGTYSVPVIVKSGTINAATVGTVTGIGVVTNLTNGTIQNSGTVTGVGVVSALTSGTVAVNTPGTITSGSIAVTSGTGIITVGTIGGKAASGAAAVANPVQIAGTDSGGTIYSPLINTNGAVGSVTGMGVLTTVTNLSNGTIQNSGTVTGVGVISNLTQGSINITAGTIGAATINTIGTLTNLANGTIQNSGTTTGVGVVSALTSGTLNLATVTMTVGTVNAATINAGTTKNDGRPARNILSFGTTFGNSGSANATMVGSAVVGAGTSIWVTDLSIVNTGTSTTPVDAGISFGTILAGSANLVRGHFGGNGGIEKAFPLPVNAGMTNFDLTCYASAGTCDFNVSYFISA